MAGERSSFPPAPHRASLVGQTSTQLPPQFTIGKRVEVQGKQGTIRYVGTTSFAPGNWVGVELDEPAGKNNGVVQGRRYFMCKENYGVFVRSSQIKIVEESLQQTPLRQQEKEKENITSTSERRLSMRAQTPERRLPARTRMSIGGAPPTLERTADRRMSMEPRAGRVTPVRSSLPPPAPSATSSALSNSSSTPKSPASISPKPASVPSSPAPATPTLPQTAESPDTSASKKEQEQKQEEVQETEEAQTSSLYDMTSPQKFAPATPVSTSEKMVPFKDYEELRMKLKFLQNKRAEDREKIRGSEQTVEEAEKLRAIHNKLQAKLNELQQELRETKHQLKDALNESEQLEIKYGEAMDSLESVTLDREMAEERAENLQQEVEVLKERLEEMAVNLEVYKKEADLTSQAVSSGGDEIRSTLEFIQLEKQNERLKDALVRLRDVSTEQESELNKKIRQLEKDVGLLQDYQEQNEKLKESLQNSENQIEDLKERLEDALGAEEMIEHLTEKNLALGEKIEEMRKTIEDLEELKELNDQLEEDHVENEKQLQQEIDHKDMLLREQQQRIKSLEDTNADYQNTISQFRNLVGNLQSDLNELRQKEQLHVEESKNLMNQSQSLLSLNMKLQSTALKAQAKAIDLELRRLDAQQATEHLSYIQAYLPEAFFKTENDSIRCLLLFGRLAFKAELIVDQWDQKYNISERLSTMDIPEELVSVCEARQKMAMVADLAKTMSIFVGRCSTDQFLKMGQVYLDVIGTERKLDGFMSLLRNEELKASDCCADLQRIIGQLSHLIDLHAIGFKQCELQQLYGYMHATDLLADTISVNLLFTKQYIQSVGREQELNIGENSEQFENEFIQPLSKLASQAISAKAIARKILRHMDEIRSNSLTFKQEVTPRFKESYQICLKLAQFAQQIFSGIPPLISESKLAEKRIIPFALIQQLVFKCTEATLGIEENLLFDGGAKIISDLRDDLGKISEDIVDENQVEPVQVTEAPWIQRACDLKAETVVNEDIERKVQLLNEEIMKLLRDIKLKDQALQESQIKIELLQKRYETLKQQVDLANQVQNDLERSRGQEKAYEEALETLHADLDSLEKENAQLKRLAQKIESQVSSPAGKRRNAIDELSDTSDPSVREFYASQLETLMTAVRYLRQEAAQLRARQVASNLQLDRDLLQPARISKKSSPSSNTSPTPATPTATTGLGIIGAVFSPPEPQQAASDEWNNCRQETRSLLRDAREWTANLRVVDLTLSGVSGGDVKERTETTKWKSYKKTSEYQYREQRALLNSFKERHSTIKGKLQQLATTKCF
ncbi:uncharacterized protein VTP21DRAFT_8899 [Calcarisporiella thermophila]|uniref:uncharacterized protein n=1 Tax=Calcarisporiella thermophila TaxID=911321 RepID=UPI0037430D7E